jgi:hypothetical protein
LDARQASAVLTANLVTTINTVNGRGQPTQITDPNGVITTMTPAYARWRVLAGAGLRDGMGRLLTTNVNPGVNVARGIGDSILFGSPPTSARAGCRRSRRRAWSST